MASDAVVTLVVDATDAEATINAQLRRIVGEAERRAPDIDIDVVIDQRTINDTFSQITDGLTDVRRAASDTDDDTSRLGDTFGRLGASALSAVSAAGRIGLVGSLASASLPAVGALVTSLASIAPAATAGITAFVAMKAASATLKVGLLGVSDALQAVFDPKADPAAVAEALENLSDNAKDFVLQAQKLKPAFDDLRLDIQDRLFQDLDKTLRQTAKTALPDLRKASLSFADSFNQMAKDVGAGAQTLSEEGTLGKALGSGTDAFKNFERIPGQVVVAIGRLAAAGGPLLDRLTSRIEDFADSASKALGDAFESGALEDAVSAAGDALAQLGRIGKNVFEIIGNVMNVASESGSSLFGTLEQVTQALADLTATTGFQETLGALIDVGQTLISNILPILEAAFEAIGPVIQALAPFVQQFADAIGPKLQELIVAIGPLLTQVATLFGEILVAITPLIEQGINILIEIMPELTELFGSLIELVIAIAPLIEAFAVGMQVLLVPAIETVIKFLGYFVVGITEIIEWVKNVGVEIIEFAQGPLGTVLAEAIAASAALLRGDWSEAWKIASDAVEAAGESSARHVVKMSDDIHRELARQIISNVGQANSGWNQFLSATVSWLNTTVEAVARFGVRINETLGGFANSLYQSGARMISSFVDGMRSQFGSVSSAAESIVSAARDFFPFSPAKKGPFSGRGYTLYSGQKLVTDFARGIESRASLADSALSRWFGKPLLAGAGMTAATPTFGSAGGLSSIAGQTFARLSPTINVFLGNEMINSHVQSIVDESADRRDRLASQGVRV